MSFRDTILQNPRPASVRSITLPRRLQFFPSPADWRDEVLYFLLPDRFSDGGEGGERCWTGATCRERVRPTSGSTAGPKGEENGGRAGRSGGSPQRSIT